MREHALLQPSRSEGRRRRPGYFQVTRPDELWHLDMTRVWVAEHGWTYLNAAIDCCTREITGWALDVRCRAQEATAVIDARRAERGIAPGRLTLGTDNGSAFTSRALPRPPRRARDHAPPRRLPRPREPGLHRVLRMKMSSAAVSLPVRLGRCGRRPVCGSCVRLARGCGARAVALGVVGARDGRARIAGVRCSARCLRADSVGDWKRYSSPEVRSCQPSTASLRAVATSATCLPRRP